MQTTTYDASNRPTEIKAVNGSTVITDLTYGYAATGSTGYNPTAGNTGKDSGVVTKRTDASWAYAYDNAANRLSQVLTGSTGGTAGTTSYGYNAVEELSTLNSSTTNIAFGADGNEQAASGSTSASVPVRGDGYTDRSQVASITAKPVSGNRGVVAIGPAVDIVTQC